MDYLTVLYSSPSCLCTLHGGLNQEKLVTKNVRTLYDARLNFPRPQRGFNGVFNKQFFALSLASSKLKRSTHA